MKKILSFLILLLPVLCNGQVGVITTAVGNGSYSCSGDGGPATAAGARYPDGIAFDNSHNMYLAQIIDNKVRKVSPSGIIITIAGNGSTGFSGDGGPATAARLDWPYGLATDKFGNLYIADEGNIRIRKIDTAGIITTFAGGGTTYSDGVPATSFIFYDVYGVASDSSGNIYVTDASWIRKIDTSGIITTFAGGGTAGRGDGGAATAAMLNTVRDIAFDQHGNLYLADIGDYTIRKISASGIISTVAGSGSTYYSGDGGAATAAGMVPYSVDVDRTGNIYIADSYGQRVRMVNTAGVISTVAGCGYCGYVDGGLATMSTLGDPEFVRVDAAGILWISDQTGYCVRKVQTATPIRSDSFLVYLANMCGGIQFNIVTNHYTSGQHVKTYFGEGSALDTGTLLYSSTGNASFFAPYYSSGNYTIKHVLYNGSTAVDSITYSRLYKTCQDIGLSFYYDFNSNCIKDSSEQATLSPLTAEVDSNGVAIDTISSTSGFYYTAYGNPSDIYTFRIISAPPGLTITCPSSGIINDTLFTGANHTKSIGFSCSATTSAFDLSTQVSSFAGRHAQSIDMVARNSYCTPTSATLTMRFSPLYAYESASPTPASVVGNLITWNLGAISSTMATPPQVHVTLGVPGAWLTMGDTIHSTWTVTPSSGDIDTSNNVITRVDTVTSSYDPNNILVSPARYILPGAQLQYTINFENTGNDTAFNIYVMDTLSDNVDPGSMRIVTASAAMNTTQYYDTVIHHNIIKFEFPNINLLDSSHHNQCDGFVMYNIKTNSNLTDGTTVYNHAGIFFDYNPVVMTDTATNIVDLIHGNSFVCLGATDTLTDFAPGGIWAASNSNATVSTSGIVTGITTGLDTLSYSVTYANGTFTTSKIITVNTLPVPGSISGSDSVCTGAGIALSESVSGGAWHSLNSHASVSSSGVVTGISQGLDSIVYRVSNSCGIDSAIKSITIKPLTFAGGITGADSVCAGSFVTLYDTIPSGTWRAANSHATVVAGVVTGVTSGIDTIYYALSGYCGADSAAHIVIVNPAPNAGIISGTDSLCVGGNTTLTETVTGGTWSLTNTNVTIASGVVSGVTAGLDTVKYSFSNSCGIDSAIYVVHIMTTPATPSISGLPYACMSRKLDTLAGVPAGGAWSSTNTKASVSGGIVTGLTPGLDTIIYSLSNYCGTTFDSFIVTIPATSECDSMLEIASVTGDDGINIYPNPATHEVTFETNPEHYNSFMVFDVLGKELMRQKLEMQRTTINIGQLPVGVYYVKFTGRGVLTIRKIVKR